MRAKLPISLWTGRPLTACAIARIRAWLVTLSLSAVALDVPLIVMTSGSRYPEAMFHSARFRLLVVLYLVIALTAVRFAAQCAYRSAIRADHARFVDDRRIEVEIADDCPLRALVVLHLRFSGIALRAFSRMA